MGRSSHHVLTPSLVERHFGMNISNDTQQMPSSAEVAWRRPHKISVLASSPDAKRQTKRSPEESLRSFVNILIPNINQKLHDTFHPKSIFSKIALPSLFNSADAEILPHVYLSRFGSGDPPNGKVCRTGSYGLTRLDKGHFLIFEP